jgi:hypothetical protein
LVPDPDPQLPVTITVTVTVTILEQVELNHAAVGIPVSVIDPSLDSS